MQASCNECGATLDINADTRFIVCHNCSSSLRIERKGNTIFTSKNGNAPKTSSPKKKQLIDLNELKIPLGTDDTDDSSKDRNGEIERIERTIARLDREWQNTIPNYQGKHGLPPDPQSAGYLAAFVIVISIIFTVIVVLTGHAHLSMFSGIGAFFAVLILASSASKNTNEFHTKKKTYEEQRSKLLKELKKWESK